MLYHQTENDILRNEMQPSLSNGDISPGSEEGISLDGLNVDELAAQMAAIAQEVANVQMEMQRIKGDSLQDIAQQLKELQTETATVSRSCEEVVGQEESRPGEWGYGEDEDDEGDGSCSSFHSPIIVEPSCCDEGTSPPAADVAAIDSSSPSSSLRRVSSYGAQGKLTPSQRRISWSESVVDNAKSPGEDSLSDMIKKRTMRHKSRQRGESSTITQTILYCLLVFVLSNIIPRLLQQLANVRAVINEEIDADGTEESHFFDDAGGEF
mmetsp:Transcript_19956/g.36209  ORF Transcript_19956/g.36209 Transcript_19956/m.36209 type:complete len:267 (+) Transcript_19956:169-969(+)